MIDINKLLKSKVDKVFCDYAKQEINTNQALNNLNNISLEIKNNPFIKKRELKSQVFQTKRYINKGNHR